MCTCSLQVAGDHFAIIMGPVLSIYLFKIFIKQQLVHDEKKFIKHFEQRCRDMYMIYRTVLMIVKAVHVAECIKKLN